MWYAYVLKSRQSDKFYAGCSENPEKRIAKHNRGKVKSTKPFAPYKLIHKEEFSSKTLALKRELFLKTGKGREFINTLPL